mmetsp:Transcript_78724/g.200371  ORF Transcript_78724/g.200371 Transcript_78724/m.200371 type:complete len:134 (+) Transcript_78724:89-490(+)
MALRLAALRRFAKSVPLGLPSPQVVSLQASVKNLGDSVKSFKVSKYFEEKYFWEKANVGPFFLLLLFTPTIYRSIKDAYWTRQLRKMNTEEIISDRYDWLKVSMIQDEVEAELLKQVPSGGIQPLQLGAASPP